MDPAVQEFIQAFPDKERKICKRLRAMILEAHPGIRERMKYKIPFFDLKKSICYLSPREGFVELGFTKGHLMQDPDGLLSRHELKIVRYYKVASVKEIDEEGLKGLLFEAIDLDSTA